MSERSERTHARKEWMVTIQVRDNFMGNETVQDIETAYKHTMLEWNEWWAKQTNVEYIVGQLERAPTTGKYHLQLFLRLKVKTRFAQVKGLWPTLNVHLESMHSTTKQCIDYCTKEETRCSPGGFDWQIQFGDRPVTKEAEKGKLDKVCERMREGATLEDIADEFPTVIVRNIRGLKELQKLTRERERPEWKPVEVWHLWGKPGCGKTKAVFDWLAKTNKSFYCKTYSKQSQSWWSEEAQDAEVILLDDFEGADSGCEIGEFLHLTGGYGHTRSYAVKGGFIHLDKMKYVIITSNNPADRWWPMAFSKQEAVKRRINCTQSWEGEGLCDFKMPEEVKVDTDFLAESVPMIPTTAAAEPFKMNPKCPSWCTQDEWKALMEWEQGDIEWADKRGFWKADGTYTPMMPGNQGEVIDLTQ